MATLEEIKKLQQGLQEQELVVTEEEAEPTIPYLSGLKSQALQGLTFGLSDEVGAAIGSLGSLFTDETFSESFDRRLKESKEDLQAFQKANPKSALGAEIVGSVAPAVASLLLMPFTGGASGTGAVAASARILSNPLLAGKIAKPGSGLLSRAVEGAKVGALQGGISGVGYAEGGAEERLFGGALGATAGGVLGAAIPTTLEGAGKLTSIISSRQGKFNKEDVKSIRIIADQFARDEIPIETVLQKIQDNIAADKLIGLTPVEILSDYGGDAVTRKLRGIKTRVPGMNIEKQLIERTSGTVEQKAAALDALEDPNIQSSRILKSLEDVTKQTLKTPKIDLSGGVDDLIDTIDSYLGPMYEQAFIKNQQVGNLDLYKYLQNPVIREAYEDARNAYREKLIANGRKPNAIPPIRNLFLKDKGKIIGVNKQLPLEFLDLIKKSADQQTYEKVVSGSLSKERARDRKKLANNFRDLLKESTIGDEYVEVLKLGSDKFALLDAFEKGAISHKPSSSAKAFFNEYNNLKTNVEKDAFKVGVFQEIYNQINKTGDNINLVKKIFDSPDLRQKLSILFENDIDARGQFINKLIRESNISLKTGTIIGGSNTAEKLLDAEDAVQALSDLTVAGTAPTSSAGIRAIATTVNKARDIISNPTEKRARSIGNVLLEQNPQRQQEILELMQQLQGSRQFKEKLLSNVGGGSIRYGSQQFPQFLNEPQ